MKSVAITAGFALGLAWTGLAWAGLPGPVKTQAGMLQGSPGKDGPAVTAFLGVPYAAPPVGDLRWKPPARPVAWQGVRNADQIGDDCPQPAGQGGTRGHKISEDCLNLNLWTGASSASERRPVMVWIHGGGNGSASGAQYDGENLAKKGVVLVSLNFRVGVIGDLAAPDLDKESPHHVSGNYGTLDQIAALRWIQNNITAFGGDPKNVTIFGQSAGAGRVDYVSVSPLANGLFKRTIAQSHVRYYKDPELFALPTGWTTKADGEATGVKFEQATGAGSLAEMRQIPWEKLVALDDKTRGGAGHMVDGYVIPHNNGDTFKLGKQDHVFYMSGDDSDESGSSPDTAFDILTSGKKPATNFVAPIKLSDYLQHAHDKFGKFTDEYLKLYPASTDRESFIAASNATRDSARVSSWMWNQLWTLHGTTPVYTYSWTHAPPGPNHDLQGAFHSSEIAYIWNHPSPLWTAEDQRISDIMSGYFVNYATKGNPNGPGLPKWPAWSAKSSTVMEVGDHFQPIPLADKVKIAFWKRFFAAQSGNRPPPGAYQARAVRE